MDSQTPHRTIKNPTVYTTVGWMVRFAKQYSKDLNIRALVEKICANLESGDYSSEVLAIYYWCHQNIRYMRDIDNVEFLKTPAQVVATSTGDCDDMACLLAAMLIACGNQVRFVIVDLGPKKPVPVYTHVFVQCYNPPGKCWITIDPVSGIKAGDMHLRTSAYQTMPVR